MNTCCSQQSRDEFLWSLPLFPLWRLTQAHTRASAVFVDVSATHPFARRFDVECHRAEQVLYALSSLAKSGFVPDLIMAHLGWGETLPLRTIFPDAHTNLLKPEPVAQPAINLWRSTMSKRMKSESKAPQDVEEKKQHELTVPEGEALRSYISRLDEKTAPTITISKGGKEISIDHPDKKIGFVLLTEALGTTNADFAIDIIVDLMAASQEGLQFNHTKFNAMLSMVIDAKPRDQSEAQLAVHKAIAHPRS